MCVRERGIEGDAFTAQNTLSPSSTSKSRTACRALSTRTVCFTLSHLRRITLLRNELSCPCPFDRGPSQPCTPSPCPVEGWQEGQPCCRCGRGGQGCARGEDCIGVSSVRSVFRTSPLSMHPCNALRLQALTFNAMYCACKCWSARHVGCIVGVQVLRVDINLEGTQV